MINLDYDSIVYQSYGKLADLAEDIAETRKQSKIDKYLQQATQIRYYLRALRFTDYITDDQVNQILQCLVEISGIQDYPVAPNLPTLAIPNIGTTIIIQGTQGERGEDGGGTDFSASNVTADTIVDSFEITAGYAARWDYLINGTAQRAGTIFGTWTEDGANIDWNDTSTPDVNGSTDQVEFSITYIGSTINLQANVTGGTWVITGSRYFIPNNGSGVQISSSLANGKIFIGNASNQPAEQTVSGDITITSTGVTSISNNVIVNADINSSAAIAVSKLATLTASRAVVSDASGFLTTSASTSTEVGYLSGVTSGIQAQLDTKLSAVSGAISTVVAVDLTASRAVISNPSGKIAVSGTTSTELGYVSGVTSAIQTQLNTKVTGVGSILNLRYLDIGDWDMDTTATVTISHGLLSTKIRGILSVSIRNDDDDDVFDFVAPYQIVPSTNVQGIYGWTSTDIFLTRITGGLFDSTGFNATSYNRGFITILYEA